MIDQRFEAWWTRNPARAELNPVAKEVARTVWHAAQNDLVSQLRSYPLPFGQALQEPTPWYPDDSGEWVEGHPRDLPPDTLMAGWLVMAEREAKSYTILESVWPAKELTSPNIVAYKVVKPCK